MSVPGIDLLRSWKITCQVCEDSEVVDEPKNTGENYLTVNDFMEATNNRFLYKQGKVLCKTCHNIRMDEHRYWEKQKNRP